MVKGMRPQRQALHPEAHPMNPEISHILAASIVGFPIGNFIYAAISDKDWRGALRSSFDQATALACAWALIFFRA